jgi:hypothetical protein
MSTESLVKRSELRGKRKRKRKRTPPPHRREFKETVLPSGHPEFFGVG